MDEKLKKYPKTDKFVVVDTIGVPHPYCITPRHVAHASDRFGGMLTKEAIRDAEKNAGASCDICRKSGNGILSIEEHGNALLIEVDDSRELKEILELHPYLLSIKEQATKDGFAGFAFKQKKHMVPA